MNKMKIRRMIENASGDRMVQDKLIALITEVMDKLKMISPSDYEKLEKKMFDNGMRGKGMIDKDMAEYIVDTIYKNNNIKQTERLFTMQKAEQLAQKHNIPMNEFSVEDWYITLVMAETDFRELLGSNMENYCTYAKLWLMDKDAPDGGSQKLCDYLTYVSQVIDEEEMMYDNGYTSPMMYYARNGGKYYDRSNYDSRMRGRNMGSMSDNRRGEYNISGRYDNGNDMYDNDSNGYDSYDDRGRNSYRYNRRY